MQPILKIVGALVIGGVMSSPAVSEEVKVGESKEFFPLTEEKPYVHVIHDGR